MINNPTGLGVGCNFQKDAICLLPANLGYWGFPQYIEKYFAYISHSGECKGNLIAFSSKYYPPEDSIIWNFGDPPSGALNFSTLPNAFHVYNNPGNYKLNFI